MLAKLRTFALLGIDAVPVEVEVDAVPAQLPKTVLVGLPELAVRESVHRIERALANLGYARPTGRTIINLAPADRRDRGATQQVRRGLRRRPRAGVRQAGAHGRRGRRSQRDHAGVARQREDDARPAGADDPAVLDPRREPGDDPDLLGDGEDAA